MVVLPRGAATQQATMRKHIYNNRKSRPRKYYDHIKSVLLLLLCMHQSSSKVMPKHGLNTDGNGTCPLVVLLPFTDSRKGPSTTIAKDGVEYYGGGTWPDVDTLSENAYALMASAKLAADHFNKKDSSVVPDLADEQFQTCNVKFPNITFIDTSHRKTSAARDLVRLLQDIPICTVVGPETTNAIEGVSSIADAIRIPEIDYGSIDERLGRRDSFPALVRMIPKVDFFAEAIAEYVGNAKLDRQYVAVIYDQTDYGQQFEHPIETIVGNLNLNIIAEHFTEENFDRMGYILSKVVEHGYTTIFLITEQPAFLKHVAELAEERGLIGEDYFWVFTDGILPRAHLDNLHVEPGSSLDKMLKGSGIFRLLDPFMYQGEDDKFLASWRAQGSYQVNRLNNLHPLKVSNPQLVDYFEGTNDYFQTHNPAPLSSYIYDSLMLAGMSSCRLIASMDRIPVTMEATIEEMLQTKFSGASGDVKFVNGKNGRSPEGSVAYGMYNIRHGDIDEDGLRSFDSVLTSVYEDRVWTSVNGTEFIYFDGTNDEPMPLRITANANYLSKGVHIVGLTLMSLAMATAFFSGLWVWCMRKNRKILAAQPEFLYILCFGSALQASSIALLSYDESYGWSETKLNNACTAFPWCFFVGYLTTYCALFSKLLRTNKVFSLRRRRVKIRDTILPLVVVLALSILVLILWTAIDRLVWERKIVNNDPLETYGRCESLHHGAWVFVMPQMILIVAITVSLLVIVWRTKDIQNEFAESNWIFYGIMTHLQAWVVALPVWFVIDTQSSDAKYIVMVMFISVFSTTLVILIIWPKMFLWALAKIYGDTGTTQRPKVNLTGKMNTHVSGFGQGGNSHVPGATSNPSHNVSTDKSSQEQISILSSENCELKKRLAKYENEQSRTSIP